MSGSNVVRSKCSYVGKMRGPVGNTPVQGCGSKCANTAELILLMSQSAVCLFQEGMLMFQGVFCKESFMAQVCQHSKDTFTEIMLMVTC
jgi:hypothetical protein